MREVLKGGEEFSAKRNSIILNAGMGLYVYGIAPSIAEGISKAREVLVSGAAIIQLDRWISTSTAIGSPIVDSKKNSSSWSWWGGK